MYTQLNRVAAVGASVLLAAASAGAQDVSIDYDKAANFANYKTFAVKMGTAWGNPLSEKRVTDEIASSLAAKGWTAVAEDKADAIVVVHGATETKKNAPEIPMPTRPNCDRRDCNSARPSSVLRGALWISADVIAAAAYQSASAGPACPSGRLWNASTTR